MNSLERAFFDALKENPADDATRCAYHDWLLERGRDGEALLLSNDRPKVAKVADLLGRTMSRVWREGEEIHFTLITGETCRLYHSQDCCESVTIEDICGSLDDLIGSPLTMAEEAVNPPGAEERPHDESYTWTFYKFATTRGYVTVRFYGSSNGYYSESVDFAVDGEQQY